jgi:hypothetical protein
MQLVGLDSRLLGERIHRKPDRAVPLIFEAVLELDQPIVGQGWSSIAKVSPGLTADIELLLKTAIVDIAGKWFV